MSSQPVSTGSQKEQPTRDLISVIARNATFVLGSQVVLKILAMLFNVYVVRRLGAVHFGRYATVMAYVAVFSILTDLGIASYSVREMAEDLKKVSSLLPNVIAIRFGLSLIVAFIAPLSAYWLGKEPEILLGIAIASVGLMVYAFQGPLDSALTARERLDYTAVFSVINQLVFWGLGVVFLVNGMGFIGLIIASLSGVAVVALLSGWVLFRKWEIGRLTLSPSRWPHLLLNALPFSTFYIAENVTSRFDTILMSFVLSAAAVGWYNVPVTLMNMVLLVAQSIAVAMYPSMVRGYKVDPDSLQNVLQRSVKYLLVICLPIVVGGTVMAEPIIVTLYTEEFINSVPVLRLMLWALPSLFLLELLGRAANTLHLERAAAKINLINAGITILLNLLLIPSLGLVGGALAYVIGRTLRLVQFWSLVGSERLVGNQWMVLLRATLAAALMGGAVFLLRNVNLFLCIGCGALSYVGFLSVLRVVDWRELSFLSRVLLRRAKAEEPV